MNSYFRIPIPPSVNHLYATSTRRSGKQIRVLSTIGRAYKGNVGWLAKEWMLENGHSFPENARYEVSLQLWFPDRRRRDITNCIKIAEDAVTEALGFDDCLVDKFTVQRMGINKLDPHALISVDIITSE